jgi:uncharacterized iron-regulated protein
MWFALTAAVALGQDAPLAAPTCSRGSVGKLVKVEAPAVIVLGERKGTLPDLSRAKKVVAKLAKKGPVTLALQAVRQENQAVLDQLAAGQLAMEQVPAALDWENSWGFPFEAYAPLLATADRGVKLVAIGEPYSLRPEEQTLPLPPGYFEVLADPMGDNPVPPELESPYVEFVAWADHQLASNAISAWDGQGVLVVVVDRFHVEGGLGVSWQAQRLTEAQVSAAILADAESLCYPGDTLLP